MTYGEKLENRIVLWSETFSWTPAGYGHFYIPKYNIEYYCEAHGPKKTTFWFFTIRKSDAFLSDYLTDLKLHRTKYILSKIAASGVWAQKPPDHQSNALPSKLDRNLLGMRFLKWALFVSCTTSHVGLCSFLESIEYDFIKALIIPTDNQIVT